MSEPTTVGDLEPDAIVLRLSYGRAVHLPNSECAHLSRETDAPNASAPRRCGTIPKSVPIAAANSSAGPVGASTTCRRKRRCPAMTDLWICPRCHTTNHDRGPCVGCGRAPEADGHE
jgi:hypothetical protein